MEKLFPLSAAGFLQLLRGRKRQNKGPGRWQCPVLKSLQRCWIILPQGSLKLIHQGRALLDQCHFIPADQPQLHHPRILWQELSPIPAISPKRLGQAPAIKVISFSSTGQLAIPVTLCALGIDRIHLPVSIEQLIHCRTIACFHSDWCPGKRRHRFVELFPSCGRMIEAKIRRDLSRTVYYNNVMMIAGPVQRRKLGNLIPWFHWFVCAALPARLPGRSQPDTKALLGQCSLSDWPGGARLAQRSLPSLRKAGPGSLYARRGRAAGGAIMRRRRVIHNLPVRDLGSSLRSIVNNNGSGIRAGVRVFFGSLSYSRPRFASAAWVFSGDSCSTVCQPRAAPAATFCGRSSM